MNTYYIEWWEKNNPKLQSKLQTIVKNSLHKNIGFAHMTIVPPFESSKPEKIKEAIEKTANYESFDIKVTHTYCFQNFLVFGLEQQKELIKWRLNLTEELLTCTNLSYSRINEILQVPFHITIEKQRDQIQCYKNKSIIDNYIEQNNSLPIIETIEDITILKKVNARYKYNLYSQYNLQNKEFIGRDEILEKISN